MTPPAEGTGSAEIDKIISYLEYNYEGEAYVATMAHLISAIREVVRDAERYRWLRANDAKQESSDYCFHSSGYLVDLYRLEELDAAIDSALSPQPRKEAGDE